MRGVLLSQFGPPQMLVPAELPDPVAGPGQALIAVEYANITFVDTQLRAGEPPNPAMLPKLPMVPGNGVGGRVIELGPGVDAALLGTRVVSSTGGSGGYAERVAVDASVLIGVPDGLAMANAVALLADGRTAIGLVRAAEVRAGETVLVEAAAGGVGSLLVQLARSAGARVVAAAGGERKLALARQLGAEVTVDYSDPDWCERVRAELNGSDASNGFNDSDASNGSNGSDASNGSDGSDRSDLDVVFDGVGGAIGRAAFELLARGGRMWSFGLASGAFAQIPEAEAARRGVRVTWGPQIPPHSLLALTRAALDAAAAGRLRPIVGQTYPLDQAAAAHAAMEARTTLGKTLLVVHPAAAATAG